MLVRNPSIVGTRGMWTLRAPAWKICRELLGINFQAQKGTVLEFTDRQGWLSSCDDASLTFLFLSSEWLKKMGREGRLDTEILILWGNI